MVRFLACLVLALCAPAALAQTYPTQPIRLLVAFPPGGGADVAARILAASLGEQLGQSVVVENVSGAGGTIGTARAAHAAADGYTLLVGTPSTHGANVAVYDKLNYDPVRDFAPIMLIGSSPLMLLASPSFDVKSVKDLVSTARAKPGAVNYASYGTGSINHLAGELFASLADIDVTHVPYRGGAPALADLIAGRVQYTFDGTASLGQVKGGKVKLVAVTSRDRWSVFPDVPTVAETVPGYEASAWFGMGAPKGTPPEVIAVLNKTINEALADPNIKARLAEMGGMYMGGTPADFGKIIVDETEKWRKVVEFAGASVD